MRNGGYKLHWIYRSRCRQCRPALQCSPTVVTSGKDGDFLEEAWIRYSNWVMEGDVIGYS